MLESSRKHKSIQVGKAKMICGRLLRTPKGKKGVALAGFALTKPTMIMKATRTICRIVMTVLNALDSRVPRISSRVNSKHHPRANLVM